MISNNLTKLRIKNAEFYSYHGVKSEERKLGGKFQVDLELVYDSSIAIVNDDVKNALNYEEVMFCIDEVINGDNYRLIETIANEILYTLFDKFAVIARATVCVRKMNVPMRRFVDYVEVEQTMSRQNDK